MSRHKKLTIHMTLSIGFAGGRQEETLEIDDAPEDLTGDALDEWLHENYWEGWAQNFIDGGVSVVEERGEV